MAIKGFSLSSVCQSFTNLVLVWMVVSSDPTPALASLDRSAVINAWHTDCHSRCGVTQLTHMTNIACRLDPYNQENRVKRSAEGEKQDLMSRLQTPFLEKPYSAMFLTKRVRHGHSIRRRGIVDECCHKGCTWEEYAEYCRHNLRIDHDERTQCNN
ncbi:probable insulin-like peptide 7 [Gigantopelta aegis]|uniref:probable insulin-like peptide 7 n=1 Tax=Gigantopelta aegis TaxID=1735272 RepID=UPI001B88E6BB|nr:probable insulin-like peptide 7 [Gigantopelta aegis]